MLQLCDNYYSCAQKLPELRLSQGKNVVIQFYCNLKLSETFITRNLCWCWATQGRLPMVATNQNWNNLVSSQRLPNDPAEVLHGFCYCHNTMVPDDAFHNLLSHVVICCCHVSLPSMHCLAHVGDCARPISMWNSFAQAVRVSHNRGNTAPTRAEQVKAAQHWQEVILRV